MKLSQLMYFDDTTFGREACPFLAEFLHFDPEKVVFTVLGKIHFLNNFYFPSPNRLPSFLAYLGLLALFVFAFNSNLPFLVIFVI